jgi:hypothetical protein
VKRVLIVSEKFRWAQEWRRDAGIDRLSCRWVGSFHDVVGRNAQRTAIVYLSAYHQDPGARSYLRMLEEEGAPVFNAVDPQHVARVREWLAIEVP